MRINWTGVVAAGLAGALIGALYDLCGVPVNAWGTVARLVTILLYATLTPLHCVEEDDDPWRW